MHSRFINSPPMSGEANMALDVALLANAPATNTPVLRLYSWVVPTLSLGYFQEIQDVADPANLKQLGVGLVRRPTGGGAILHHREITLSLILPAGHALAALPVADSYITYAVPLVNVLHTLNVDAGFRGGNFKDAAHAANCFAGRAGADLVLGGKKLFGSAQRRRKEGVLFHGSLLLDIDQELWREVFGSRMGDGFCGLESSPGEGELRKLIRGAYEPLLGGLKDDQPDFEEIRSAGQLEMGFKI